jgi:hypothetical protein
VKFRNGKTEARGDMPVKKTGIAEGTEGQREILKFGYHKLTVVPFELKEL